MPGLISIKELPVFKAGKHIDSKGKELVVSDSDLDGIVRNFNADVSAGYFPPVVLGHPKMDDPRYGGFSGVKKEGGVLVADVGVIPELHASLKKGQYPDRSLRLAKLSDGTLKIKHLGLLGVVPPGVQGLPAYQFEAPTDEEVTIDFSEASAINSVGRILARLRDFLIEKYDQATADRVVDAWDIDELKNVVPDAMPAQQEDTSGSGPSESVPMMSFNKEEDMTKIEELEQQLRDERAARQQLEKASRLSDFNAFCAGLRAEGKLTPAMEPTVLDFMEILSGVETFDFAEQQDDPSAGSGQATRKAAAPVERFKALLKGLPKIVEFAEFAKKEDAGVTVEPDNAVVAEAKRRADAHSK